MYNDHIVGYCWSLGRCLHTTFAVCYSLLFKYPPVIRALYEDPDIRRKPWYLNLLRKQGLFTRLLPVTFSFVTTAAIKGSGAAGGATAVAAAAAAASAPTRTISTELNPNNEGKK